MEASQEGHLELVRYLLEARADVNATTGIIERQREKRQSTWYV
jgi:ankyrin repeat protein